MESTTGYTFFVGSSAPLFGLLEISGVGKFAHHTLPRSLGILLVYPVS